MTDCPLCRIPRFLLKPRETFQEVRNEPLSVAAFTLIPLVVLFAVLLPRWIAAAWLTLRFPLVPPVGFPQNVIPG